jgi:long-chain acyl-CoA synthetase
MTTFTTEYGEKSKYFGTSIASLKGRVELWAKANGLPTDGVEYAFNKLQADDSPFKLVEEYIRTDDGTTNAPHLRGMEGKGQKYRYFKNGPQRLPEIFKTFCKQYKDNDFLVCGIERYSFGKSYELASGLGYFLRNIIGCKEGEPCSMLMRNYPEWILAFMGSTSSGLVSVPTNSLWTGDEISYGLNDSGATVCFCDGQRAAQVLPLCREGKLPHLKAIVVSRDPSNVAASGGGNVKVYTLHEVMELVKGKPMPSCTVSPEANAIIMYTSGTTSAPKGVVSTHRNVVQSLRGAMFYAAHGRLIRAKLPKKNKRTAEQPAGPRANAILCPVPLFHATGTHAIFLLSVFLGRKLVLMTKWSPLLALQLIEAERISSFTGVPTMSLDLLNHPDYDKYDTSTLKSLGGGGAAPPKKLSAQTAKAGKKASQGWGLTESNAITVQTMSSTDYIANPSSCGRAVSLIDVKIVDPEDPSKEVPPNTPGEVLIRGITVMKEYLNKSEKTIEAMSKDGWFRSGDIGRLDDTGALYIMDRLKDLIIRGGENISCAEVESAIYEHPSVMECAVFAMPDERLGEVVAAAIVLKDGAPKFTAAEMILHCQGNLAKFKVPTEMYIWNEQLPRGATGKIPKRTIRDQLKSGVANATQILPLKASL